MKPASFVLAAALCLFAATTVGQQEKRRTYHSPVSFCSAEKFLGLDEINRQMYVAGLMDGFYTSAFFGASDDAVAKLDSCTQDMDLKQISAIITKYLKDHPEYWHLAVSPQAISALNTACHGGLKHQ